MDELIVAPTPERARRGVERLDKAIADEHGRPSQPYRCIDTLGALHRRGAITAEQRQAGEEFQATFRLAALDRLQAADMSRPFVNSSYRTPALSTKVYNARESVEKMLSSVGGLGSPAGSCLWHVLGWGMTLKEWAIEQGWRGKPVSVHAAPYILIGALNVLAPNAGKTA